MKRFFTRALVSALVVCVAATAGLALSRSLRSDNAFAFSWEQETDTLTYAVSSRRIYRHEGRRATLTVYVEKAEGTESPRLEGTVVLTQKAKKQHTYDGTLRFLIKSGDEIAYETSESIEWVLGGDQPLEQSHTVRFDLPTGVYRARATFRSDD